MFFKLIKFLHRWRYLVLVNGICWSKAPDLFLDGPHAKQMWYFGWGQYYEMVAWVAAHLSVYALADICVSFLATTLFPPLRDKVLPSIVEYTAKTIARGKHAYEQEKAEREEREEKAEREKRERREKREEKE